MSATRCEATDPLASGLASRPRLETRKGSERAIGAEGEAIFATQAKQRQIRKPKSVDRLSWDDFEKLADETKDQYESGFVGAVAGARGRCSQDWWNRRHSCC
jgi:hypothetical protein